ncbi:predicted protein [Arabidopsis lyrata subsp. lyrata]|uniref:Predicted protein n=1 Tax=Arabidopsis lyrata subsp. lyrata TaxID=81972 RepID=D7KIK6_ARALL|nr:predicted protein [Arabidopsis lyrata subsp. lyrata]
MTTSPLGGSCSTSGLTHGPQCQPPTRQKNVYFYQQNLSSNDLHVLIPKRLLESTKRIGYTKILFFFRGAYTVSIINAQTFFFRCPGWYYLFPLRDLYSASTSPISVFRLT